MSSVYGCRTCAVSACSYYDDANGPGCNGWVARGAEVPLLHSITLPPAPRSIVLSADIGTACNQIHELYGDGLVEAMKRSKPNSDSAYAHIAEAMKSLMEAEALRIHARMAGHFQQGETDAPGTPRPAGCTCTSFDRCEPCRIAKALAEGKHYAIRWHQPDGKTGIGDAFVTREACQESIERGRHIDRINGRVTLMRYSVADLAYVRCPGCGVPEGCNCKDECPDMAARVAAMVDPLDVEYDGMKLRELLAIRDEHARLENFLLVQGPWTPAQRAAVSAHWSAQLRAKVDAATQAERNVVTYCELDPDD